MFDLAGFIRKAVGDVSLYFGNFLAKETSTFHRKVCTETVEEVKSISESIIISVLLTSDTLLSTVWFSAPSLETVEI